MIDSPPPLPCDVLPCPGGDVIIVPRGQLTIRLTPEQRERLRELLADPFDREDGHVIDLACG